jgi:hypothetical protein
MSRREVLNEIYFDLKNLTQKWSFCIQICLKQKIVILCIVFVMFYAAQLTVVDLFQ